jgi:hypothetical protein
MSLGRSARPTDHPLGRFGQAGLALRQEILAAQASNPS